MDRTNMTGPGCWLAASAAVVALTLTAATVHAERLLAVPSGYELVWSDEFEQAGHPDPAKWAHDTGRNKAGWYNRELQYYAGPRLENAQVKDGRLHITARKEALRDAPDWGGQSYTSARLITRGKAEWTYGFVEVRAKLPCGVGTWPAIWTVASDGTWPSGGEMDIMEHVGHSPRRVFSAVHTTAGNSGSAVGGAALVPDACTQFHRYQMHWTPDEVRFGIDGFAHLRYPNLRLGKATWPFDAAQFLILNIAIGGDLGGAVNDADLPRTMEVDYVRVYQRKGKPPQ